MLGERSFFRPSCLNDTSIASRQQGQLGCSISRRSSQSTVNVASSNGSSRFRLRSIIPARMSFARERRGARARASRRFRAWASVCRSAYRCRRRSEILGRFSAFHRFMYSRAQGRHVLVRPPTHSLLGLKNSEVAGNSAPHFAHVFIAQTYSRTCVWGNQTDKFASVEAA